MTFGERLVRLRTAWGFSLTDLARESGTSRSYLYQLESGESEPTIGMLAKLCAACGVTPNAMLGYAEESTALADVAAERRHQDTKWGEQNHTGLYWLAILTEEVGEVAKALITDNAGAAEYRAELVHVAAVAVAAIESLDRQIGRDRA